MTLASSSVGEAAGGSSTPSLDVFGMWQLTPVAPQAPAAGASFAVAGPAIPPDQPSAVWRLDLSSADNGQSQLADRANQLNTIDTGLDDAGRRLDVFLNGRNAARIQKTAAFGISAPVEPLPPAEMDLSLALDSLEAPGNAVSFGLLEDAGKIAGEVRDAVTGVAKKAINWDDLNQSFDSLVDVINRQVLHFVYVDTAFDSLLVARTVVNWGGDATSCIQTGLSNDKISAHERSLELALASRISDLRAIMMVSQMAGKIALAVTTPLGPLQAILLGWQFVQGVVLPLIRQANVKE